MKRLNLLLAVLFVFASVPLFAQKGSDLNKPKASPKIENLAEKIKKFMESYFVYDYVKAIITKNSYLADIEETYSTKLGICLDFSAVFAAMARAVGIPTKVNIGYLDSTYHAWNSVFLGEKWLRVDITSAIQKKNTKDKNYKVERFY